MSETRSSVLDDHDCGIEFEPVFEIGPRGPPDLLASILGASAAFGGVRGSKTVEKLYGPRRRSRMAGQQQAWRVRQ